MNNAIEIPGPFVVLQGIPGDGLANTMLQDEVDEEFFDWDDDHDDGSDDDDDDDEMEEVVEEEEEETNDNRHHEEAGASTTTAISGTSSVVGTTESRATAFLGQGLLGSGFPVAAVSSTAAVATTGTSSLGATAAASHLDAAVRPTILPAISDATGGAAAAAASPASTRGGADVRLATTAAAISSAASSQRQQQGGASSSNHDVDDFVVVDDGNQNNTGCSSSNSSSTTAHAENAAALLPQQAALQEASAAATASMPEQQQQQQPQSPARNIVNERAERMIDAWENCSRSRVAHHRRDWVMNAKATAPQLVTLDIQPWLAPTTHQLAVFDQLPTNAALLNIQHARRSSSNNNNNNNNSNDRLVSSTAKMVGSLAPGTTVVGAALFTFEIISSGDSQQQSSLSTTNSNDHLDNSSSTHSSPGCLIDVAGDLVVSAGSSGLRFCQKETCRGDGHSQSIILAPKLGRLQFLQLLSGGGPDDCYKDCFVLYSIHGYTVLGGAAGMSAAAAAASAVYAQPDAWFWKVTCPLGAYVREGLDLTSRLKKVLPYGTVCQVQRKLVNAHGLARLSIRAMMMADDEEENAAAQDHSSSAAAAAAVSTPATAGSWASLRHQNSNDSSTSSSHRGLVEGWISQYLNPMSGQGGPVVQPISFCVPAFYRVTLPSGAVVRQEIELCSPQIGHIPCGCVVTVTGRAFSEFPADQCIERLRLAPGNSYCNGHGGGWISARLNKRPPEDQLIVQYAGFDPSFDTNQPGVFHYRQSRAAASAARAAATRAQQEEQLFANAAAAVAAPMAQRINLQQQPQQPMNQSVHEISSIDENESRSSVSSASGGGSGTLATATRPYETTTTAVTPQTSRRRRRPDTPSGASASAMDNSCLFCIDKARNATIVHGSTGHIACCLDCARMLKASGQPCPVCRLQIDSVILHYWA